MSRQRRPRLAFEEREVKYLKDGVEKYKDSPQRWRKILTNYNFHPRRTSVDLKDKWRNMLRVDPERKAAIGSIYGHKKVSWTTIEIEALKIGHKEFGEHKNPWASILQKYKDKFDPVRTSVHLKDKWRNLTRPAKAKAANVAAGDLNEAPSDPMNVAKQSNKARSTSSHAKQKSMPRPPTAGRVRSRSKDGAIGMVSREAQPGSLTSHPGFADEAFSSKLPRPRGMHESYGSQAGFGEDGNPGEYVEEIVEYVEEGGVDGADLGDDDTHEIEERVVEETQPDGTIIRTTTRERVRKRRRIEGGEPHEEREILTQYVERTQPSSVNSSQGRKLSAIANRK